jgi:ABC-type transport system involved in multi-copper enzyme maturation permease subunit
MTRFAWRQFRPQALIAFGVLAAVVVFFIVTHPQLVDLAKLPQPDALLNRYGTYEIVARLLLIAPALIGVFWGAPLLAREFETGTFRLVWTQSVTRRRWLAVKLTLVGGASVIVTGLLSWAVTWWSGPVDRVTLDRFSALVFSERGLVPLGYAAFAFAVGVALGLLLRRTVPAMAATLAVFVGARLAFTQWIRPHLMAPVHQTVPLTSAAVGSAGITSPNGPLVVTVDNGVRPGAWASPVVRTRSTAPATWSTDWARSWQRRASRHRTSGRPSPGSASTSRSSTSPQTATGPSSGSRPASSWAWHSCCWASASGGSAGTSPDRPGPTISGPSCASSGDLATHWQFVVPFAESAQ